MGRYGEITLEPRKPVKRENWRGIISTTAMSVMKYEIHRMTRTVVSSLTGCVFV